MFSYIFHLIFYTSVLKIWKVIFEFLPTLFQNVWRIVYSANILRESRLVSSLTFKSLSFQSSNLWAKFYAFSMHPHLACSTCFSLQSANSQLLWNQCYVVLTCYTLHITVFSFKLELSCAFLQFSIHMNVWMLLSYGPTVSSLVLTS